MKQIFYSIILLLILSCQQNVDKNIKNMLKEWMHKEFIFPENVSTTLLDGTAKFTIVNYVDSIGCLSCKLNLRKWKELISDLDTTLSVKVHYLFVLQTAETEKMRYLLKWDSFTYPIYFDDNNTVDKLNNFPQDDKFHTFLLDKNNRVLAIGNPIHNPKVKELYMNIIQGKANTKQENSILTKIRVKENMISLGRFNWQEEQKAQFMIYNVGKKPLVINDVTTSCGCTSVDYPKQPVSPGDSVSLQVTYKADHPEHFDKTITVYCNTDPSLIQLKITGDAE